MGRILVVDDDPSIRSSLAKLLTQEGHEVHAAGSGEEALESLDTAAPDLVLLDIRMDGLSGFETLRRLSAREPRVPVVLMTAYATFQSAVDAMKLGAFEFLVKPFETEGLRKAVASALEVGRVMRAGAPAPLSPGISEEIVGRSPGMYEVFKLIGRVAGSNVTVLIRGESGTGKELVARAIHRHSPRADRPFITVNCAAIPETLLESELFGYEKGAFTGAAMRRLGKFEQAQDSTIFLDEIGDMTPATQAKVLRVLQEQSFERLGGNEAVRTAVRILAATNRDLEPLLQAGRFREDLYYRLNVVTIRLPPLRERREDIPLLTEHFLRRFELELGRDRVEISPRAAELLRNHDWPGNVRELEHALKQAVVLCQGGLILPEHVHFGTKGTEQGRAAEPAGTEALRALARLHLKAVPGTAYARLVEQAEAAIILEALQQTGGNLAQAARLLGLSRPTLRDKINRYQIQRTIQLSMGEE